MNLTYEQRVKLHTLRLKNKREFNLKTFCFPRQLKAIEDPSRYKLYLCSRRAGKTVGCAADLISHCLAKPKRNALYITLSRNNAKKIIWNDLSELNREYKLGARIDNTELSLKLPNGSNIYLSGAKDKSEIEKFRGLALSLCYIDEAQSFRDYIRELVDDVISKALYDHNGTLCLTGTPSPVPTGYFHECYKSPGWSVHEWTMFDNPWIEIKSGKKVRELVDEELKRKGVTIDDPGIQREVFGKWVIDHNSLVFRFEQAKNTYSSIPLQALGWNYIFGIDIGFDDSDAIAVLAWNDKSPVCYLVEEVVTSKQGITGLASQVSSLIEKYNPHAVVMDTGGLGKKIADEMNTRFGLPIKPAEKARKFEYIELLNDAMRTKMFFAKEDSQFAQDAMLVEWDKDSAQLKVSDRFHSDICDAVLYAFRESLHWLSKPDEILPMPNTEAWYNKQAQDLEHQAEVNLERKQSFERGDFMSDGFLTHDKDWE